MSEKKLEITSHHEEILKSFPELSKILPKMSNDQRISLKQYLETLEEEETGEESEMPISSELQDEHAEQDVPVSTQYLKKYDEYLQEQEAIKDKEKFIENYSKLQGNDRINGYHNGVIYDVFRGRNDKDKVGTVFMYNIKTKECTKLIGNKCIDEYWNSAGNKYVCVKSIEGEKVIAQTIYDTETGKEMTSSTDGGSFSVVNKNGSDLYISNFKNIDNNKLLWYNKFYDQSGILLYEGKNISNFYYDKTSGQIAIKKRVSENENKGKFVYEIRDTKTQEVILEVDEQHIEQLASTVIGKRILDAKHEEEKKQHERDQQKLEQEKFCKITHDDKYRNFEIRDNTGRVLFQGGNQQYNFHNEFASDFIVLSPERKNETDPHIFHIFDQGKQVNLSLPAHLNVSPISIEKMRNIYSARVRYNNQPATVYFNKQGIKIGNVSYNGWGSQNDIKYDKIDDNLYQENGRYRFIGNFDKTQDDSLKDKYKIIDTETGTILEDNNFTTMHHVIREDDKIVFIVSKKATPEKKEVIILPIDKNSEDTSK